VADSGGAATDVGLPAPLVERDDHPFVGRQVERRRLHDAWRAGSGGRPQLLTLAGEPGVGKSRLAQQFAQEIHGAGGLVLFGRCDEEPLDRYQPFVEAIHEVLSRRSNDAPPLPRDTALLARLVPDLADRLPAGDAAPLADPDSERFRLFEGVASLLAALAADAPVLFVVDDLHWADRPTLLLLRHVLRPPRPLRLTVVATYRDSDLDRDHPLTALLADLHRDDATVERVTLRGLDTVDVTELLARLAGHEMAEPGRQFAAVLQRATAGNSFFLREIIQHLVDTGVLFQKDGRWTSTRGVDISVPDGVRAVVLQRVRRLSEPAQRALLHGAVIGRRFDIGLLAAITGDDEAVLCDALDEALRAQLVVEAAGVDHYSFAHAIVRETLYATVSFSRRARLHRLVGDAIERTHLDGTIPPYAELARHFAAVPDDDARARAVDYATRAGHQAMEVCAYEDAVRDYEVALAAVGALPATSFETEARLLLALGNAKHLAADLDGARATFARAADLGRRAEVDAELMGEAALGFAGVWGDPGTPDAGVVGLLEEAMARLDGSPPGLRSRVLTRLSMELCFSPDGHRRGIALADQAVAEAETAGDHRALTAARWHRRSMLGQPVEPAARLQLAAETLASATAAGDASGVMSARGWLLLDHLERGQIVEARADIDAYGQFLRQLRLPFRRWYPTLWRATLALLEGRADDAEALAHEAMAMAGDEADGMLVTNWSAQLYALRMLQGRLPELRTTVEAVVDAKPGILGWRSALAVLYEEIGEREHARAVYEELVTDVLVVLPYDMLWPLTMVQLADLCTRFDDERRAPTLYESLLPWRDTNVVVGYSAFFYGGVGQRLGQLAALQGLHAEAEACLVDAAQRARAIGAAPWAATAECELAFALERRRTSRDRERARALRAHVLDTATQNGWGGIARRAGHVTDAPTRPAAPVSPW
jgi:hypothetical protein